MNACKLTVSIEQLRLRAVFTPIFQTCIQHSPTFRICRDFPGFFSERLIGKNHFQRIVITHKNIGIDIVQYLLHGSLRLLQRCFNLPAFSSSRYNLRYLAHQFHIFFIPLFVPTKVERKKAEMYSQLWQGKDSDGFYALHFEHLSNKRIERINIGRTNDMVFFQHVEPGFSRFNGHTPQVIDSGFYTVVAPFVGAAIRNSVEVVFPCRQTVDTSITANFGQCHIHSSRYIRFQLQNLQYLDK